ncbi:hypothetical protein LTR50_001389 [Elasticomyces elasticus]|nr:hypothetical protein LTR50_001389 [Elasticomyces elasticus]
MADTVLKTFTGGHIFSIDDEDEAEPFPDLFQEDLLPEKSVETKHVSSLHRLLEDKLGYTVHKVSIQDDWDQDDWLDHWGRVLLPLVGSDELCIIYYNGSAGGNGDQYTWHFRNEMLSINAHDFMRMFDDTKIDVLLILDCYFPSRYTARWDRTSGITEVIARGIRTRNQAGVVDTHISLTSRLVHHIERFAYTFNRRMKSFSVPQLLGRDKTLAANPAHLYFTKYGRIMISPSRGPDLHLMIQVERPRRLQRISDAVGSAVHAYVPVHGDVVAARTYVEQHVLMISWGGSNMEQRAQFVELQNVFTRDYHSRVRSCKVSRYTCEDLLKQRLLVDVNKFLFSEGNNARNIFILYYDGHGGPEQDVLFWSR